ncbi:MAG TPA: hypothetical protein VF911_18490 [Thermoanaerobaculia bacterium]|jgi:uncharacterized membrane protein (DUF485 family)
MSDPVLALILIVSFFAVVTAASFFKRLDAGLWSDAGVPIVAGVICGVLILFAEFVPRFVATGVMLTLAALYVRLTGSESEPTDGMTLGAVTGAAAAVPLVLTGEGELLRLAECILAGAIAGFGITFALTHVRDNMRQAAVDAATAGLAIGAAWLPAVILRSGAPRVTERHVAIGAAALVPFVIIITVFKQWPSVSNELRHEASLGFIDPDDVRGTAHPLLRLGRGGWHNSSAHREFVRIANRIALRKRQQRSRSEQMARLYQLEVIKLRMELQEMTRIDRAMRMQSERAGATGS